MQMYTTKTTPYSFHSGMDKSVIEFYIYTYIYNKLTLLTGELSFLICFFLDFALSLSLARS